MHFLANGKWKREVTDPFSHLPTPPSLQGKEKEAGGEKNASGEEEKMCNLPGSNKESDNQCNGARVVRSLSSRQRKNPVCFAPSSCPDQ